MHMTLSDIATIASLFVSACITDDAETASTDGAVIRKLADEQFEAVVAMMDTVLKRDPNNEAFRETRILYRLIEASAWRKMIWRHGFSTAAAAIVGTLLESGILKIETAIVSKAVLDACPGLEDLLKAFGSSTARSGERN